MSLGPCTKVTRLNMNAPVNTEYAGMAIFLRSFITAARLYFYDLPLLREAM